MRAILILSLLLLPGVLADNHTEVTNATADADPKIIHLWENPLGAPLDNEWGVFLLSMAAWAVIAVLAVLALGPLLSRLGSAIPGDIDDKIIGIIRRPGFVLVFLFGFVDSFRVLDAPEIMGRIIESVWGLLVVLGVTWVVYRIWHEVLLGVGAVMAEKTESDLDDRLYPFFAKVGGVVIIIIGFFFAADAMGINLALFAAGGAVLSLVVAFAAQDTLGNFFAGVFILLDQPFRENDRIEIMDIETWGDVKHIGLRSTRIRTRDNRMVIVPNGVIGNGTVVNHTFPDPVYRIGVDIGVAYGTDVHKATEVLLAAARSVDGVMQDERFEALIVEFADSSINFHVRCWFPHYLDNIRYKDKLNRAIYDHLAEANIEIPFPQRVVHMVD